MKHFKNFFLTVFALSAISAWSQDLVEPSQPQDSNDTQEQILQQIEATPETVTAPEADVPATTEVPVEQSQETADVVGTAPEQPQPIEQEVTQEIAQKTAPTIVGDTSGTFTPDTTFQKMAIQKAEAVYDELDDNKDSANAAEIVPAVNETPVLVSEKPAETTPVIVEQPKEIVAQPIDPRTIPDTPTNLDILHGNAYNIAGNEAAAPTVAGEIAMPHKMYNRKFAYIEPVDSYGAISFGKNTTYFLAFDNSQSSLENISQMGLLTAGFAKKKFGASIEVAMGKNWTYIDDDVFHADSTIKATTEGTLFGGTVSAKLSNFDAMLHIFYMNPNGAITLSLPNEEIELDDWSLGGKVSIANSTQKDFAWAFNLNVLRYQSKVNKTSTTYFEQNGLAYISTYKSSNTDSTSRIEVVPEFNLASAVLKNEKARIFLGLNTTAPLIAYDRINGVVSRHNEFGLTLTPNILAEAALGKYVIAFGSASYRWDAIEYRDSYINSVSMKRIKSEPGVTTAVLGMRLQCDFAALEMAFTQQFLQNPFGSFSDHDEIAMSIGAFVNF